MGTILDLLGSLIFGGALLVIILSAQQNAAETQSIYQGDMTVQELLVGVTQPIEAEFRNMGFGAPDTVPSILEANSHSIKFLTCLDSSGSHIDTVRYWLGDTSEVHVQNRMVRNLYRHSNKDATSRQIVGLVSVFTMKFINADGDSIPTPVAPSDMANIQTVEITVEVQNPYAPYRDETMVHTGEREAYYSTSLWQQTRLASQNFRR